MFRANTTSVDDKMGSLDQEERRDKIFLNAITGCVLRVLRMDVTGTVSRKDAVLVGAHGTTLLYSIPATRGLFKRLMY